MLKRILSCVLSAGIMLSALPVLAGKIQSNECQTSDITDITGIPKTEFVKGLSAPEASAPTGEVAPNKEITLSAGDGAIIYYTVDGSEPTITSAKYDGGIIMESSCTVKAIAAKKRYVTSEAAQFT